MSNYRRRHLVKPGERDLFADTGTDQAPIDPPGDPPGDQDDQDDVDPRLFGDSAPDPDPLPVNRASLAIHLDDCETLRDWIYKQDFPIHRQVTPAHLVTNLSGMIKDDFRWLCYAMQQANRAPAPADMRRALISRDVADLRDRNP